MTWEEFKQKRTYMSYGNNGNTTESTYLDDYKITDVDCPKCGNKIYKNERLVLTSLPPKHQYICKNCDWVGYA